MAYSLSLMEGGDNVSIFCSQQKFLRFIDFFCKKKTSTEKSNLKGDCQVSLEYRLSFERFKATFFHDKRGLSEPRKRMIFVIIIHCDNNLLVQVSNHGHFLGL